MPGGETAEERRLLNHDSLTAKWSPAIASALASLIPDPAALAEAAHAAQAVFREHAQAQVQSAMRISEPTTLVELWTDAYGAGTGAAKDVLAEGLAAKADQPAADATAAGGGTAAAGTDVGLTALLATGGAAWAAMAASLGARVATAIAQQLIAEASVEELASAITEILHDPARAEMIAQTEITRAMTAAELTQYAAFGADMIRFLSADDQKVCPLCGENEDHGPVPVSGAGLPNGLPPVHPRCRCTVIPAFDEDVDIHPPYGG